MIHEWENIVNEKFMVDSGDVIWGGFVNTFHCTLLHMKGEHFMHKEEGKIEDEGNGTDCDCGCECADSGCMVEGEEGLPVIAWPDPQPEELDMPEFNAVWQVIKSWDINVPEVYMGYCGATGNHVKAILDALRAINPNFCPPKQIKDS